MLQRNLDECDNARVVMSETAARSDESLVPLVESNDAERPQCVHGHNRDAVQTI